MSGMEKIVAYTPLEFQPRAMRRDLVVAQLDYGEILSMIANRQTFTIVSGLNPSSGLHLGHKVLFDATRTENWVEKYIPISDDESCVDGKVDSLAGRIKNARKDNSSFAKMGFDPTKTHYLIDTEQKNLYKFALEISRHVNMLS